ncbi:MAG TPA: ribbon-helix-helix protein, CopG family [Syntrophothermus lipocalidus]|uniref:CopG domain protein DNA-binding domain protein n=1 Tax=Syntrophothermus lipocalidus (strain DSM 12680 / TGB-C1) TaxID=643648 RepID=D7CJU2_SYNLT|nr:CopG family transcriptional regulator [Syntrophothermus lipocalidus]ADI01056.1 CopG domain protein DNA-binding domain protein [Syntrophothermus lipocalidus DSM 12680]HHV77633.1 ribbon-helix-helix protein, CopG family [Syntrophothermus lipocalidus]
MDHQNITLSLPKELLRRVKHLAVERDTSVSALLIEALEEAVLAGDEYDRARDRQLALMEKGLDLGTQGLISWKRDELHER